MERTISIRRLVLGVVALALLCGVLALSAWHGARSGSSFHAPAAPSFGGHGFGPGHGAFHRGPVQAVPVAEAVTGAGALFVLLVKVGVAAGGLALWMKASGFLRWGGAILGFLALLSLLSPVTAVLVLILLLLLQRVTNRRNDAPVDPAPAMRRRVPADWLDEWERKQRRD